MRTAVYAGTRNLYRDMVAAAKSLIYNDNPDKIYFLTEDDEFPEWLPPQIETINVSRKGYFSPYGANARTEFTYMSLMRACYTKILKEDLVLQLDVDTFVEDKLDEIWETDMTGKWFSAVPEVQTWYRPYGDPYYNVGVALFNLKQIREDGVDDEIIRFLNETRVDYIDQDAWNCFKSDKAVIMPSRYNESFPTGFSENPAIVHFAGCKDWQTNPFTNRHEVLVKYRAMTWEDALHGKNTHCRTDV